MPWRRPGEAVAAYDQVLAWFGDAPELALREQVATALVNKGVRLGARSRSEDELAAYDQVLALFADAPELALREQVATALLRRGHPSRICIVRTGGSGSSIPRLR